MSLTNPDSRRALRSVVQAFVAVAMIPMVGVLIWLLANEPAALLKIAMALLGIVALGTVFYGAENVTRAVRFKAGAGGIEAAIGDVAEVTTTTTVEVKGDV